MLNFFLFMKQNFIFYEVDRSLDMGHHIRGKLLFVGYITLLACLFFGPTFYLSSSLFFFVFFQLH